MRKQSSASWKVEPLRFASGERYPVLRSSSTGAPDFHATVYVTTQLRTLSRSTAVLERTLRSIAALVGFLDNLGIDLDLRLRTGQILLSHEIDALTVHCRRPLADSWQTAGKPTRSALGKKLVSAFVSNPVAHTRTSDIASYLRWRAQRALSRLSPESLTYQNLQGAINSTCDRLIRHAPDGSHHAEEREGLTFEGAAILLEMTRPDSIHNPWQEDHVRARNYLIVLLLLRLGIRRGELLGLKCDDCDFRNRVIRIRRRADDREDPRLNQPNTKTKGRSLEVADQLLSLILQYVKTYRSEQHAAKSHPFLLVANDTGKPMQLGTVNALFRKLQRAHPTLSLATPHVLRHTWNDDFSRAMDDLNMSEEYESRMRIYLMGWSNNSKMATTYTRRHVRRKANEASITLQRKALDNGS